MPGGGMFPLAAARGRASAAKVWALELRGLLGALTSPLCVLHESVWRGGRGQARGACTASTLGGLPGLARDPWGMATAVADSDVHVS